MFRNARSFDQPLDMWLIPRFCDVNNMFMFAPRFTDVKTLVLCFYLTTKKSGQARLKQTLDDFDAAKVHAELSRYDSKHTAEYKNELEAAHPELRGAVPAGTGTVKHKPRSKRELTELMDMSDRIPLGAIDTSCITDMEGLFRQSRRRNFAGLETWDTSNVVTMKNMFAGAIYFNHDISRWDVSSVRDMSHMFDGAKRFNQPLDGWNVSQVRSMQYMFYRAFAFNQDLNTWNVSSITDMSHMFDTARHFNGPIGDWDVSSVTTMQEMFVRASHFNQPLGDWNVSSVTNMREMFCGASRFNQPLNDWNVSNVENMMRMFDAAEHFNQPLDHWDVSKVKDMAGMFCGATSFRQPITAWKLRDQSPKGIFHRAPQYDDMESRVMCLAALDSETMTYAMEDMIQTFGEKAVHDALRHYGAKYGLKEY